IFFHQPLGGKLLDDGAEEIRSGREIEEKVTAGLMVLVDLGQRLFDLDVEILVVELAGDVVHAALEPVPDLAVVGPGRELLHVVKHLLAEVLGGHLGVGDTEDGEFTREQLIFGEVIQSGNQLAAGQIAGSAEDDHDTGITGAANFLLLRCGHDFGLRHVHSPQAVFFAAVGSTWPPNFWRMAESIFSAKVCSWRERKRVNSAAESTSTGTPWSMAAWMVQRPSPESCTKPLYSESVGFSTRAIAVRSSNHELTTLPRRQTSAMSARFRS